jgi:hypothetical protein
VPVGASSSYGRRTRNALYAGLLPAAPAHLHLAKSRIALGPAFGDEQVPRHAWLEIRIRARAGLVRAPGWLLVAFAM